MFRSCIAYLQKCAFPRRSTTRPRLGRFAHVRKDRTNQNPVSTWGGFAVVVLTCIAAGFFLQAAASKTGSLKGRVIDVQTKAPLAFANVVVVGTNKGAMCLENGEFFIADVPIGTHELKATMMGYKTVIKTVAVESGKVTEVTFALDETIVAETQTIVVNTSDAITTMPCEASAGVDLSALVVPDEPPPPGSVETPGQVSTPSYVRVQQEPWNTEAYDPIDENEFLASIDNPFSTFSIDVDAASYANVRRLVRQSTMPPLDAVRIEELINYFDYDYPDPTGDVPFSVTAEVADCPWNADDKLVHLGLQGERVAIGDLPPNNLVFLLDVSGSMQPPNKLPLLRQAFRLLAENLREEDRVAIVIYAGRAGLLLPSTPGSEKATILEAIDGLYAGGSTNGAGGIKLAYEIAQDNFLDDGNNRVILATDGDFNVGVSSDGELVRIIEEKRNTGVQGCQNPDRVQPGPRQVVPIDRVRESYAKEGRLR